MNILIPAYEPSQRLIKLICSLREKCDFNIIIVNDGSGDSYNSIFSLAQGMGCTVLTHFLNKGKGAALKTGFNYLMETGDESGVVCADCDGQHTPEDIIKVADSIKDYNRSIILGTRRFIGNVPLRSRFGNSVTRMVFSFASGAKIYDTQTGLRGFSSDMLEWLCSIPGERFEYEMNMLLEATPSGYSFHEIDIDTVYLDENKSTHFRTFSDSARVYFPILKFSMSSILSAILDFVLLMVLQPLTHSLLLAVVGSRVCSAIFNYTMNRTFVFSRHKNSSIHKSLPKYSLLALFILLANYSLIYTFNKLIGVPLFFSKIFAEFLLFLFSFWSQRKFVFKHSIARS